MPVTTVEGFRHEALLYEGEHEFVAATTAFLREGAAAGEPTLAVVDAPKIAALQSSLGADADRVQFADMSVVGQNPARLIPVWRRFVDDHGRGTGRPLRGVGEPIWPGRSPVELVECRHHEALLNVAFADTPAFRLLCPYDTAKLDPAVVEQSRRTHPWVSGCVDGNHRGPNARYDGTDPDDLFGEPLDPPPAAGDVHELAFDKLKPVRRFVESAAVDAGFDTATVADIVLAVDEIAANSIRHGGGRGRLSTWYDGGSWVCEVTDRGRVTDPLIGRREPIGAQVSGRGLWMVNQICRLLQVRTTPAGTTFRLHFTWRR